MISSISCKVYVPDIGSKHFQIFVFFFPKRQFCMEETRWVNLNPYQPISNKFGKMNMDGIPQLQCFILLQIVLCHIMQTLFQTKLAMTLATVEHFLEHGLHGESFKDLIDHETLLFIPFCYTLLCWSQFLPVAGRERTSIY